MKPLLLTLIRAVLNEINQSERGWPPTGCTDLRLVIIKLRGWSAACEAEGFILADAAARY